MNAAQYAASRLAQTEITRVITESDKDTFAEMGIDEVEIVGTLDLHTCDTCGDMDSKHMPRSEAKAGTTAPPFHPNCRCVIVPYDEEFRDEYRIMRDPVTGKSKIIENMTFKEWKEKYVPSTDYVVSESVREKVFALHNLESGIIKKTKSLSKGIPLSVEEITASKGGKSWNFFNANGDLYLQVSDNAHGHKAEADFGQHGEHCHWYYSKEANKTNRYGAAEELPEYIRRAMGDKL